MNTVIDSNDLCRKYDYSSLITATENDTAISTIESIIESGNYFTNSPPYQTNQNLFQRTEPVWLKYRMTFLTSVFLYLGKERNIYYRYPRFFCYVIGISLRYCSGNIYYIIYLV